MAKKHKKKVKEYRDEDPIERTPYLKEETVRVIYSILFFLIGLFLVFSRFEKAGPVGVQTYMLLHYLLGVGYFILPVLLFVLSLLFLRTMKKNVAWPKLLGSVLFLLSALSIISILYKDQGVGQGGFLGNIISSPLLKLFDFWVTLFILLGLVIISSIIIFETHLSFASLAFWRKNQDDEELEEGDIEEGDEPKIAPLLSEERKPEAAPILAEAEEKNDNKNIKKPVLAEKKPKDDFAIDISRFYGKPFVPPPLSLLNEDRGKPGVGDIKANANIIKRTLQNFGINVEMDEISIGPSVTRYALKPAEGVKLSKIVGLQNDLALALAAHPIRIEAPIPGKSLVGIEIPNTTKTTVGLGTLLGSEEFKTSDKPLLVALGKGISGKSHFANLAKAPHMLIAGATGSGKSVTIHAIITSLLYRNSPENLKFIMVDPKRVELTGYNKIPHLLTPVITEPKKAILALKWTAKEMDRRYDILESEKVRDIESYHKTILAPVLKQLDGKKPPEEGDEQPMMPDAMPYIVVVIDELADLMQAYPRELESAIVRLAQMSRAVGIHLMLSTQRPSVASQIDSRTILDMAGAEKLLGAGDMLFMSGEMSKPQRLQSAYITEIESKGVVKYFVDNYADELNKEINLTEGGGEKNSIFESSFDGDEDAEEDDLYDEARQIVISAGKASTSYLQRKLSVGYARAARLIDMLEERGVIGPGSGSKPREVISGGASDEPTPSEEPQEEVAL